MDMRILIIKVIYYKYQKKNKLYLQFKEYPHLTNKLWKEID